jgi:hypothetical protein
VPKINVVLVSNSNIHSLKSSEEREEAKIIVSPGPAVPVKQPRSKLVTPVLPHNFNYVAERTNCSFDIIPALILVESSVTAWFIVVHWDCAFLCKANVSLLGNLPMPDTPRIQKA